MSMSYSTVKRLHINGQAHGKLEYSVRFTDYITGAPQ